MIINSMFVPNNLSPLACMASHDTLQLGKTEFDGMRNNNINIIFKIRR